MKTTFLGWEQPLLTVMLQTPYPEHAISTVKKALSEGADAFGLQAEQLLPEYHNTETYQRIFAEMEGKPVYVTNYRYSQNAGQTDEEIATGLLLLAQSGATLCDVMGDLFDKQPDEVAKDRAAIQKLKALIRQLHANGTEVLMSSHILKYTPAERVLEIARFQQDCGADIVKIVTGADTMEQQLENLRITYLLKQNLQVPFLFLSGGECRIHRRVGSMLGNCMCLCAYEYDELATPAQPLLKDAKFLKDNMWK